MRRLTCVVIVVTTWIAWIVAPPLRATSSATQNPADIDPNALADALMGLVSGVFPDNLFDDSEYDAQVQRDREHGEAIRRSNEEMQKKWDKEHGKKGGGQTETQNEDVIPVNGDSSAPVDEIMDDEPGFRLASLFTPRLTQAQALQRPFVMFAGFRGGVIQMRVFSPHGLSPAERDRVTKAHFVLVPLDTSEKQRVEGWLAQVAPRGSGVHVTSQTMRGYCLQARNRAPSADEVFLPASRAAQEEFKPAKTVRIAAEFAAAQGWLRPQGDPVAYGRFITQYAVWTTLEHWDQAHFTDEFLARTKQEFKAANKAWTGETDQTLRALAPGRWRDVQLVIGAATVIEARQRTATQGHD